MKNFEQYFKLAEEYYNKNGNLLIPLDYKINGVEVGSAGSLANLISEYKPGDTVQLAVIRDGKEIAINVTLEGYRK